MECDIPYGKAVLISLDQCVNSLLRGWPDETLSSRCYRWRKNNIRKWPERCVNLLFFWDHKDGKRHCELSFETEREGRQLPPEARPVLTRPRVAGKS